MRIWLFTIIILCAIPLVHASHGISGRVVYVPQMETRTQDLGQLMSTGQFTYVVRLDKNSAEPVLDLRVSGYAEGNFTIWLEPMDGTKRLVLLSSKDLVKNRDYTIITGFAAGGNGGGNGNGNAGGNGGGNGNGNAGNNGNGVGQGGSPGNSANAPGHNKVSASNSESKGIARRRLENLMHRLQGFLQGLAKKNARDEMRQAQGILTKPVQFRGICTETCSLPWPTLSNEYRLSVDVQGQIELHTLHYTVLQTPATSLKK